MWLPRWEVLWKGDEIDVEELDELLVHQPHFAPRKLPARNPQNCIVTQVNKDLTFALRRSTLDFCLGGQRSSVHSQSGKFPGLEIRASDPPTHPRPQKRLL